MAPGESFSIGPAAPGDHHFVCDHPGLPSSKYTLVEHAQDGIKLHCAEQMALFVDGAPIGAAEITITRSQRARLSLGPLTFEIAAQKRARTAIDRLRDHLDGRWLRASGIALALQAGFVFALLLTNGPAEGPPPLPKGVAISVVRTPHHKLPPRLQESAAKPDVKAPEKAVAAAPKAKLKRNPGDARAAVKNVLAAMGLTRADDGPHLVLDGLNALKGSRAASLGTDGMGARVVGPGGGGQSVSIGKLGSGNGMGSDPTGTGPPQLGKKIDVVVNPDKFSHSDGLTRDEIQRVINRVMSRIKYCYEKELNKSPNLEGKVVLQWRITPTGSVDNARPEHTFTDRVGGDGVASCISRTIASQQFPKPRGGGEVWVTYPFVLNVAGN